MRVVISSRFLRRAKKLSEPQASMLRAALRRFVADSLDPVLRTERLRGELANYWSFSVDDDLRAAFRWESDEAILVNLGSDDEVY